MPRPFSSSAPVVKQLREQVFEANLELVRRGLVLYTFGNASVISDGLGLVDIKPSRVPYESMRPEHLVVSDLHGNIVEGELRLSSDLATHYLVVYQAYIGDIGGVAHTHSEYATAWAQAEREIPCFGTTREDYFHGCVPITAAMREDEIALITRKTQASLLSACFAIELHPPHPGFLLRTIGHLPGVRT